MPRKPMRPLRSILPGVKVPRSLTRHKKAVGVFAIILAFLIFFISGSGYLRRLALDYAMAEAREMIVYTVNDVIKDKMSQNNYSYNYFVNLEKDSAGNITALTTNMARINAVSSDISRGIVSGSGSEELNLRIPMGNLTGSNLLSGRGPKLPVRVVMLTAPKTELQNELISAGINQTKHQIVLTVEMKINVLVPWESVSDTVKADIIIAETIIVGQVPDSYVDFKYGENNELTGRSSQPAQGN